MSFSYTNDGSLIYNIQQLYIAYSNIGIGLIVVFQLEAKRNQSSSYKIANRITLSAAAITLFILLF